jgi:NTP pyrophosphatase (non-canonical NTP hydrolase)
MASDTRVRTLFAAAFRRADAAQVRWGPHPTCEFTGCRLAEELGELVKAATSGSEERPRVEAMDEEAIDLFAMVIRLFREWPEGTKER